MCTSSPASPNKPKPIQYLHNPILDGTSAARLASQGQSSLVVPLNTGLGIGYSRSQNALIAPPGYTGVTPTGYGDAPLTNIGRGNIGNVRDVLIAAGRINQQQRNAAVARSA